MLIWLDESLCTCDWRVVD